MKHETGSVTFEQWQAVILDHLRRNGSADVAHDEGHLLRVLVNAQRIATAEGPHDALALMAASLMHDCVAVPKDSPWRSSASRLSAQQAHAFLREQCFPQANLALVAHAIEAHSFLAGLTPVTIEARSLQDADRLDALGAIGVARCFAVSGSLGRALFDQADPLALERPLDEATWAMDHFQTKLMGLAGTMCTATGRRIAEKRLAFLMQFRAQVVAECSGSDS